MEAAKKSGRPVEVTGAKSEDSQTWANPDGTFTQKTATGPVRFKKSNGDWQDIDLTAKANADGTLTATAAERAVTLPANAAGGLTVPTPAGAITITHPGALGVAPVVNGSIVTYPGAVAGRDLVQQLLVHGVEETVVLDDRTDGASYTTSFTMPAGVTASNGAKGVEFKDSNGRQLGRFGGGVAFDDVEAQAPVATTLVGQSGRTANVSVGVDPAWAASPARKGKVRIDPVYTWGTASGGSGDTYVNSGTPDTYYDGNTDIRVGYFGTGDIDRGLVTIGVGQLTATNMVVKSATLSLYNHQSSGTCVQNTTSIYGATRAWGGSSTWNTQPTIDASASGAATFGASPCPTGNVDFDITGLVKTWTEVGQPGKRNNYGMMIKGPETSTGGWKKFRAAEYGLTPPTLTVTYNRRPNTPTSVLMTPSTPCVTGANRPFLGNSTPKLTATALDADSTSTRIYFQINFTGTSTTRIDGFTGGGAPSKAKSWTVPATYLNEGVTYSWHARSQDSTDNGLNFTGWCEFTVDTTPPATPTVTSTSYPSNAWQGSNAPGSFTFSSTGHTDVVTWAYRFDTGAFVNVTQAAGTANSAKTVTITPPAGWQTLHVVGIDRAGNRSPETLYSFGAGPALTSPGDGVSTQQSVKLAAVTGTAGTNGVWYGYRLAETDPWQNVPASAVTYPGGGNPTSIPVATSASNGGQAAPALNLNVAALLTPSGGQPVDGTVQVRADFYNNGVGLASSPGSTVTLNQNAFGASFATEQVGPGTVSLLTGNYSVSSTDASVSSYGSDLTLSRTFNSRTPSTPGVFGPGWSSSVGVDEAGSDYTTLADLGSGVTLTSGDGSLTQFLKKSGGYVAVGDAEGLKLTAGSALGSGPGSYTLEDPDGNKTVFGVSSSWPATATLGVPHNYPPTSVIQPGSSQVTSYAYDAERNVTRILAPIAGGATCTGATFSGPSAMGCRALDLTYTGSGTSKRLTSATERTTDGAGNSINVALACWTYDGNGRLSQAWDPRINNTSCTTSPAASDLPTTYTYDSAGRLATITPPGLAGFTLAYDGGGRFSSVSRQHSGTWGTGIEKSTVEYGVPFGNDTNATSGLHPDLSAATAATWAQTDLPTAATAIYGAGDTLGSTAGDYRDATIHALNVVGREVNTAVYSGTGQTGWKIDTTEYDDDGHVLRTLDAANRDRALRRADMPAVTVTLPADTASAARMLDTTNLYMLNPNDTSVETGTDLDLVDTFGPLHQVTIPDATMPEGIVVEARAHTHTNYDTGSETGHPAPVQSLHLPVSSYTEASVNPGVYLGASTGSAANDARTTTYGYTLNSGTDSTGWTFRTPLTTTVQPGGGAAAITTTAVLDPLTGIAVKTSQPSDTATTGVGTTSTTYYGTGTTNNAACINNAWYMQVCRTGPASQITPRPAGMPDLPITTTTYDWLLRPQTITQTVTDAAGVTQTRTSSTSYENSGWSPRATSTSTTNTISSGGQVLPTVNLTYDTTTGLPLTTSAAGEGNLTTAYDDFGRPVSFTDADNGITTTTYDTRGRVASTSEVLGGVTLRTTTLGYDGGNEHRGLTTSSTTTDQGGAFTGSYDAGGSLLTQTFPNGIVASYSGDETGDTRTLLYTKAGTEWFADAQISNIHGQWRTHDGLPSTQVYKYDDAGRLTEVRDSSGDPSNGDFDCQTRRYSFDVNSNRTGLTSYPNNGTDGACQQATGASTVNLTYDAADRLTSSGRAVGITYDAFGRTLNLPAALTTVSGTGGTAVTQSYYANDLILSQTAGTTQRTWQLDPTQQRFRTYTDNSTGTTVTKTNHFSDGSGDSPDWIDEGNGTQTRYTAALSGNLATTDTRTISNGTASGLTFQLTNLHGDIVTTATPSAGLYDGTVRDNDEYGNAKSTGAGRYGWLGGKRRSSETLGNIIFMGRRVYSSILGRFLTVDTVAGGNANAYNYPVDPINFVDLDGRSKDPRERGGDGGMLPARGDMGTPPEYPTTRFAPSRNPGKGRSSARGNSGSRSTGKQKILTVNDLPSEGAFPFRARKSGPGPKTRDGFIDRYGNTWKQGPSHGGDHWDVTLKKGGYLNVYPDGSIRGHTLPPRRIN